MSRELPVLEIRNLAKHFPIKGGFFNRRIGVFKAVDDISFRISRGKTFGLVGESGSGKTTVGKCILRLVEPTAGEIIFNGTDLTSLDGGAMRDLRSNMQMIYQAPAATLNRRMTIGQMVGEALWLHESLSGNARRNRVLELLNVVGLKTEHYHRYPHEFSGGQQQRVGIARALAVQPDLLILDEPTSALDVSVQAQILNLLLELQDKFELTYLFISHDLGVVRYMCDDIGLLYLGKIVEIAESEAIFERPKHPYTQALISAIPDPDPDSIREEIVLKGDIQTDQTSVGCPFAPRCHAAKVDACETILPPLVPADSNQLVACHLHKESVYAASGDD
jgi:oligopeptide/dipeptide ABC transporter ATP-binding protein